MSNTDSIAYFRLRERIERAAAVQAVSAEARRVHLELAERYADLISRSERDQIVDQIVWKTPQRRQPTSVPSR